MKATVHSNGPDCKTIYTGQDIITVKKLLKQLDCYAIVQAETTDTVDSIRETFPVNLQCQVSIDKAVKNHDSFAVWLDYMTFSDGSTQILGFKAES